MLLQIDNASPRAVYQQIIDQVKRDIALGRIRVDEKLPTVRQLASSLVINPNTIAKAYRQLEQEGIIVTRPGAGAFAAPLGSQLSEAVSKQIVTQQLERVIVDAVHMEIGPKKLGQWFQDELKRFNLK